MSDLCTVVVVLPFHVQMAFPNASDTVQVCAHLVGCRSWNGNVQSW